MAHVVATSSSSSQSHPASDYHPHHHQHPATHTRTQNQPSSAFASRTQTTTEAPPQIASPPRLPDATLRLRGGPVHDRRVTWTDDVIDNEGLGRKKSKVCCIFRRAREFGESSSEEDSSDSDSSSDDDASSGADDDGRARPAGGCSHGHNSGSHRHGKRKARRPPSPNAYEKMPKNSKKPKPTEKSGHGNGSPAS